MKSITTRLIIGGIIWGLLLTGLAVYSIQYFYQQYQRDVYYKSMITNLKLLRDFHVHYQQPAATTENEIYAFSNLRSAILEYFDERYDKPYSAWYWQVKGTDATLSKSNSLQDCELKKYQIHCSGESLHAISPQQYDLKPLISGTISTDFTFDIYPMKGALNQDLRVIISNFTAHQYLPYHYQYSLSGRYLGLDEIRSDFLYILIGALLVVTFGTLIAIYTSVKFGLKPIDRVRRKLVDIKSGKTEQLLGDFPPEIKPMVNEFHEVIHKMNRVEVENLAHNLKTPLSVLLNESEKHNHSLSKLVQRQVESMNQSINHYLERSQRSVKLKNFQSITRLKPLLQEITHEFQATARQQHIHLSVSFNTDIAVKINKIDLKECLHELCNNAIKAATSKVTIMTSRFSNNVVINVEDDGLGIEKNMRQEVCKRTVRLDQESAGSGIGLHAVKNTIMAWNGSVVLKSSSLGGLRVVITLPAVAAENSPI